MIGNFKASPAVYFKAGYFWDFFHISGHNSSLVGHWAELFQVEAHRKAEICSALWIQVFFFLSKQPILFLLKKNFPMIYHYRKCFSPKNNSQKLYSPWCPLWVLGYLMEAEIFPHNRQEQGFSSNYVPGDILHEILEIKIKIFVCSQSNHSKDKFDHITSLLLLQSKGSKLNGEILPLHCLDNGPHYSWSSTTKSCDVSSTVHPSAYHEGFLQVAPETQLPLLLFLFSATSPL